MRRSISFASILVPLASVFSNRSFSIPSGVVSGELCGGGQRRVHRRGAGRDVEDLPLGGGLVQEGDRDARHVAAGDGAAGEVAGQWGIRPDGVPSVSHGGRITVQRSPDRVTFASAWPLIEATRRRNSGTTLGLSAPIIESWIQRGTPACSAAATARPTPSRSTRRAPMPVTELAAAALMIASKPVKDDSSLTIRDEVGIARLGIMSNQRGTTTRGGSCSCSRGTSSWRRCSAGRSDVRRGRLRDAFGTRLVVQEVVQVTASDFDPVFIATRGRG